MDSTTTQAQPTAHGGDEPPVTVTEVRAPRGPALVVVGCVAFVAIGGAALALLGAGPKSAGGASLGRLPGVAFGARSAAPAFARISAGGEPPADVARALVLPEGTSIVSARPPRAQVSLYSGSLELTVDHSPSAVLTFFRRELAHDHWSVLAVDAAPSGDGQRIYAKFASADGFYWEVGVTVGPASTSIAPALGGGAATATSDVSLTVFEVDDAD